MPKTGQTTVHDAMQRIETFVAEMERKYKMSSDEMAKAAWEDHSLDTPEVAHWLIEYSILRQWRERVAKHERARAKRYRKPEFR